MDIYLIRHTKTDTINGLCYGQADVPLRPSFATEAEQVINKLPDLSMETTRIFSSPLSRCRQLADRLSDVVITDGRLLELDFGDWEKQCFDEIDSALLNVWTHNFVLQAPPNGESFSDLVQRVAHFWGDLIALDLSLVVVVTHAGVIRALLAHILNLPLANAFQFRVDPGSVHKLQFLADYTFINYLNH
jgi:alpha-ribazole phosphatase